MPDIWSEGRFEGLVARGNFEISLSWNESVVSNINIKSCVGGPCVIKYQDKQFELDTRSGMSYTLDDIRRMTLTDEVEDFIVSKDLELQWKQVEGCRYRIERACDDASKYTMVIDQFEGNKYQDGDINFDDHHVVSYKITAIKDGYLDSKGSSYVLNHATFLEEERHRINVGLKKWVY